jgi:hypothetical protein
MDYCPDVVLVRKDGSGVNHGGEAPDAMSDSDAATLFVAGEVGAKMATGRPPTFNWLRDTDGSDAIQARWFCDRARDPMVAREVAVLRARSTLTTRWRAVERIASVLERSGAILGREVDRICREAGILKAGQVRAKPFDPDASYVTVEGKQLSIREWAAVVGRNAHNIGRAREAVREGEGT